MKITQFYGTDKPDPAHLLLAVDAGSRSVDLYGRLAGLTAHTI